VLTLTSGHAACVIYPELGGSIGGWTIGAQAMVRSASPAAIAAHEPRGMASFPLVPFSNRIGHGQFGWNGQTVALTPNFAPELHAIHGVGWTSVWTAAAQSESSVTLTLNHRADARWPWDFSASQHIILTEDRLILALTARNDADHGCGAV
jgi:aldose 1-epimerase